MLSLCSPTLFWKPWIHKYLAMWVTAIDDFDQVPSLWASWRRAVGRGSWWWWREWQGCWIQTCDGGEVCKHGGDGDLHLGVKAWTPMEPCYVRRMCNAGRTRVLFLTSQVLPGWGWGVSTLGCSSPSICYCCTSVKSPSSDLKLIVRWSQSHPQKGVGIDASFVQRLALQVTWV